MKEAQARALQKIRGKRAVSDALYAAAGYPNDRFPEHYSVRFHRETPEGWRRKEAGYHAKNKGSHEDVRKQWERDFQGVKKELIAVVYE